MAYRRDSKRGGLAKGVRLWPKDSVGGRKSGGRGPKRSKLPTRGRGDWIQSVCDMSVTPPDSPEPPHRVISQ
jgi:hypothetical protein